MKQICFFKNLVIFLFRKIFSFRSISFSFIRFNRQEKVILGERKEFGEEDRGKNFPFFHLVRLSFKLFSFCDTLLSFFVILQISESYSIDGDPERFSTFVCNRLSIIFIL